MKFDYILISWLYLLAIGLGLIFGYSHGTVGFSGAYPVWGASLQLSITTMGLPALVGVPLTLLGSALLIAAVILSIARIAPASSGPRGL